MNFSTDQRQTLREAIEKSIAEIGECAHRQLFLVMMALIQDLDEAENKIRGDQPAKPGLPPADCFIKEIEKTVEELKKSPPATWK